MGHFYEPLLRKYFVPSTFQRVAFGGGYKVGVLGNRLARESEQRFANRLDQFFSTADRLCRLFQRQPMKFYRWSARPRIDWPATDHLRT